jgi:hypothetical protein
MTLHRRAWAAWPLALVITLLFTGCQVSSPADQAAYGSRVAYTRGKPVTFPDFTLEFAGTREVAPPKAPRSFRYYDFIVIRGNEQQAVSWSSGTGEIGPREFKVGDKAFLLEITYSERFGWLDEHELVVERE